ncbi:MAG: TRAP transporter small permease [Roseinatronobacter sp.]|nr:MAG: TRAP transporter small permease [Roseinatronobacter sp.]
MLRLIGIIDNALAAILKPTVALGMAALIAVITLQIVSRVFFTAVGWTEEVARFLIIWLTFLGAALAWHQGRHIAVTFLVDFLPKAPRRTMQIAALVVTCSFAVALTWLGVTYMEMSSFQRSPALRIQMTYIYAVIPLSAVLIAWFSLSDLLRLMFGQKLDGQGGMPE